MKNILLAFCSSIVLLLPSLASALTYTAHRAGYVNVYNNGKSLSGSMNVGLNKSTFNYSPSIHAYANFNASIAIHGRDQNTGAYFSCYIPTTSQIYAFAKDAVSNLSNGTAIYAYKGSATNPNECTTLNIQKASFFLD